MKVDVAFVGLLHQLAPVRPAGGRHASSRDGTWRQHVKALVVPGSASVSRAAEREGLADDLPRRPGSNGASAGCSMCLGMNPDKLEGNQVCAASSNRNFKGRQGSPTGRTLLMSPAMVAAAAVAGRSHRRAEADVIRRVARVEGRALPLPGNDIDTDRIIPARFLRSVSFDGMEQHVFEDERKAGGYRGTNRPHPFDDPRYRGRVGDGGGAELRLRVVARARAAGDPALGHPGDRGRVLRRDLLRQLGDDRPAVRHRQPRPTCRRSGARIAANPQAHDDRGRRSRHVHASATSRARWACRPKSARRS